MWFRPISNLNFIVIFVKQIVRKLTSHVGVWLIDAIMTRGKLGSRSVSSSWNENPEPRTIKSAIESYSLPPFVFFGMVHRRSLLCLSWTTSVVEKRLIKFAKLLRKLNFLRCERPMTVTRPALGPPCRWELNNIQRYYPACLGLITLDKHTTLPAPCGSLPDMDNSWPIYLCRLLDVSSAKAGVGRKAKKKQYFYNNRITERIVITVEVSIRPTCLFALTGHEIFRSRLKK